MSHDTTISYHDHRKFPYCGSQFLVKCIQTVDFCKLTHTEYPHLYVHMTVYVVTIVHGLGLWRI